MTFDGVSHLLNLESVPFPANGDPCEVWMLVDQQADAATDTGTRVALMYGSVGNNNARRIARVVSSAVSRVQALVGTGAASVNATADLLDFKGQQIVRTRIEGTKADVSAETGTRPSAAAVPATGTTRTRVGANTAATPASFWKGRIGPILITSLLSDADADFVLRYLAQERDIYKTVPTKVGYRLSASGDFAVARGTAMAIPDTNRVVHSVEVAGLPKVNGRRDVHFVLPEGAFSPHVTYSNDPTTSVVIQYHTLQPQLADYVALPFAATVYTTRTAPSVLTEFRYAVLTDTHGRPEATAVFAQAAASDPDVIFHTGDITTVNGGLDGPATAYTLIDSNLAALKTAENLIYPFVPLAKGNHDTINGRSGFEWDNGLSGRKASFSRKTRGDTEIFDCLFPRFPGPRGYGVMDFGNWGAFFALDTISTPLAEQKPFFTGELAKRKAVLHKTVGGHYGLYPTGRRAMFPYYRETRAEMGPIFRAGGVRTWFVGHEHVLSYTTPIVDFDLNGHQKANVAGPVGEGIEFFGSGPGQSNHDAREGRNPATKSWIAFSKASSIERFDFELPGYVGEAILTETRDAAAGDGTTFPADQVGNHWLVTLTPTSRNMKAIDATGAVVVNLTRSVDPIEA